jgi:hypothetical protein
MKVYKYMPTHILNKDNGKVNLLKYIFEDKTLWFSNPLKFNDPFELRPNIKNIIVSDKGNMLVDTFSSYINDTNQAHKFYYASMKPLLDNVGILSLSGNKEHLAMWAHYADNHKGLVLEFEKNHWFFNDLKLPSYMQVLHGLEKVTYILRENRKSINSNEHLTKETFLTKSIDWEYEDEYRMSLYVETNEQYLDGITVAFPNELLTAIYFGNQIDKEVKQYILDLASLDEWKHLRVFQMEIDEMAYKLIPRELKPSQA